MESILHFCELKPRSIGTVSVPFPSTSSFIARVILCGYDCVRSCVRVSIPNVNNVEFACYMHAIIYAVCANEMRGSRVAAVACWVVVVRLSTALPQVVACITDETPMPTANALRVTHFPNSHQSASQSQAACAVVPKWCASLWWWWRFSVCQCECLRVHDMREQRRDRMNVTLACVLVHRVGEICTDRIQHTT